MILGTMTFVALVILATVPTRRRQTRVKAAGPWAWLADPRSSVLVVLAAILLIGGGRRWLRVLRSRRAVERVKAPNPTTDDIAALAEHDRAGILDLFRIHGTAHDAALRDAAGHALSVLWARDQLVPEEEKAIVTRGFSATWRARRRYPRGMRRPIPIEVRYGIPFLRDSGPGVSASNLEWSHRIVGAERASLESFSDWQAGSGRVEFTIDPGDFPTNGPHRLVLQTRVRTVRMTSNWEVELPHSPFSFEFDPILAVGALLTMPDETRGEAIARSIQLVSSGASGEGEFLELNESFALRDPPRIGVKTPLPCDLAHAVEIEFEGVAGRRVQAGTVVLSGQGIGGTDASVERTFPLGPVAGVPQEIIERPGIYRLRAILAPDAALGWADPEIRSIWPGTVTTDWREVRVVRR
jgi:hypothetical protein